MTERFECCAAAASVYMSIAIYDWSAVRPVGGQNVPRVCALTTACLLVDCSPVVSRRIHLIDCLTCLVSRIDVT